MYEMCVDYSDFVVEQQLLDQSYCQDVNFYVVVGSRMNPPKRPSSAGRGRPAGRAERFRGRAVWGFRFQHVNDVAGSSLQKFQYTAVVVRP